MDEWINLVNSSNVIAKGKARLNRNSMYGRDRHQQTLTARKVDGPLLAGRPALGGGGGGGGLAQPGLVVYPQARIQVFFGGGGLGNPPYGCLQYFFYIQTHRC